MREFFVIASLALALFSHQACAQGTATDFCDPGMDEMRLLACAQSAAPESPKAALAYANLGSHAYARDDLETAAWFYLRSMPGRSIVDIELHTNRADVLAMMDGGLDLAISDASIALRMAREGKDRDGPVTPEKKWTVLPRLVQILDLSNDKKSRDEAAAILLAMPASSADDFSDRARVLTVIGRPVEALAAIDKAILLEPGAAMLKNNKCVTLMNMNRDAEALDMCKAAYAANSKDRVILHSLMDALARNARCTEGAEIVSKFKKLFPDDLYADGYQCPRPRKS